MDPLVAAVIVACVLVAATAIILLPARRRRTRSETPENPAVSEFAALPEPARCDMIFAAAALDGDDSATLLRFALDDPSEAVALAAARALLGRGNAQAVDEYLERHPGDRTERISRVLSLVNPER
jgi:hypothetical protein